MATQPRLFGRGFLSLLSTQFLGAANDNILKQILVFMIATGIWSGSLAEGGLGDGGQSLPALCLTLPFILVCGVLAIAGTVVGTIQLRKLLASRPEPLLAPEMAD